MGTNITRREFSKLLLTAIAGSVLEIFGGSVPAFASQKKVVIVGGGFGGTSAAKYLRLLDPSVAVTLVEPDATIHTCAFSNLVLGGMGSMQDIAQTYTALKNRHGVTVVADRAVMVDASKHTVTLKGGKVLHYDRLIVSPGIGFRWNAIEGYSEAVAGSRMPHAYRAGTQTLLLRRQLLAMRDGGTVLICPPVGPFRCPSAPYERASLIAHYLRERKPKSKIIILDPKEKFSKQALFRRGWDTLYPGMIEWRSGANGGKVARVDAKSMRVATEFGEERGDAINFIPPQQAGGIAFAAGLTDVSGWCPVNPRTFESTLQPDVHVVGDSCIAGAMPKSGFAASSQGKIAAAAIVRLFRQQEPLPPKLANTCYSIIGPDYGISVAGLYQGTPDGIVDIPGSGGFTPIDADADHLREEAMFAVGWYKNISQDIWG